MRSFCVFRVLRLVVVLAATVLLWSVTAVAQYRFDHWTTDNDLPQNSVYSIAQTPDGYLWFTTLDGLVRFDGVRFKVFNKSNSENLPTNRLRNVFAEEDGTLWISNENAGLTRFQNNKFKTFTTADGLISNDVHYVLKDLDGSLMVFAVNGMSRTRDGGGSFTVERRQDKREYNIWISPSGARWEVNKNGLFSTDKTGQTRRFDLPFDPVIGEFEETFNFAGLVALFEDKDGSVWIGTPGKLSKLQNGVYTAFTAQNGVPANRIRFMARDGEGDLWVATEKEGACRLSGERFTCFTTAHGLSSNNVTNIFVDRENTPWFGTENGGINHVSRQIIESLSTDDGLVGANLYPILQDRSGAFWLGSFSGLSRYSNGKVVNYTKQNGLLYELVQSLFEDRDGTLWVGSVGGVLKFENGKSMDFTEKLGMDIGEDNFWDIHQTADGAMWFATDNGLFRYADEKTTRFSIESGLPSDDVKIIYETRDGALWFGTTGGVVSLKDGQFTAFTEKDGLAGNFVRAIYEDEEGLLWFGTYDSGLSLYRNGKFTKVTAENGLFSNGVFAILPDARGNFWMSSNQGIYRVSRQQLIDFADGKAASVISTAYNKSDGMLSTECNGGRQPAGIRALDGRLWFPTQNGAAIVNPEDVPFNPLPPPVVIESISIEGKPVGDLKSEVVIQPGQNNFAISYTGLSFIKPEQMRFRYKLEGLDENWTDAANRREAFYPYLPPGDYVFHVMAANSDNVWSEQSVSIQVQVLPPFYLRWWFVTLSLLAVGGIVYWTYKKRVNQLENARLAQEEFSRRLIDAHETERRRIAAELHDSLGQSLAIIKNQAVFGSQTSADLNAAKEQFEQISNQSARAISEVREIAYNLRPYLLDRLGLTRAVKSMLNKISEVGAIDVHSDIDNVDGIFPVETEISIYRILQESFNNILKHSEASEAKVSINKNERLVTIKIEDNGRGFDASQSKFDVHSTMTGKKTGFGLLGMAERIKMIGGTQTIESEISKGTVIKISLRVPENK